MSNWGYVGPWGNIGYDDYASLAYWSALMGAPLIGPPPPAATYAPGQRPGGIQLPPPGQPYPPVPGNAPLPGRAGSPFAAMLQQRVAQAQSQAAFQQKMAEIQQAAQLQQAAFGLATAGLSPVPGMPGAGLKPCNVAPKGTCGPPNAVSPIGFDSVSTVAAGATADVTSRPQMRFQPKRIIIPSTLAADFRVEDIKVGNRSQLANSVGLPGALFSNLTLDSFLVLDALDTSQDFTLRVTNTSAGALRFQAACTGEACM